MALAHAILKKLRYTNTLESFVSTASAYSLKILEINEAGGLNPTLSKIPGHLLIKYPEYDMTNLPFSNGEFDIVIHSDTLEHVNDPIQGLSECKRILKSNGACIYTVPIIVDRLTRSRKGLKDSYHGISENATFDFLVHTEFGADMWSFPLKAGFQSIRIHNFDYPASIAIEAGTE